METTNLQPRYKDSPHFIDFWTKGNGKLLIDFSGAEVSFKDFEKFSPYYYHVDETGDQVVEDIYFTKNFRDATKEIEQYIRNGVSTNENAPESVKNMFLQTQTIPESRSIKKRRRTLHESQSGFPDFPSGLLSDGRL